MSGAHRRRSMSLSLDKALDLMRRGARLMMMHSDRQYYVVPGGHLKPADAQTILNRPDVLVFDDAVFPGHPQSWKIGG